jgi:hypothetical protein
MPEEKLDIRSPRIYCKSITKFDATNVERFREMDYLKKMSSQDRLDLDDDLRIDRIDHNSLKSARLAVEVIAKYFRREFEYDFPQYEANEITNIRDRIYLMTLNRYSYWLGVGAVCFRWRQWTNAPHGLALAWLWINPFLRRKGILSVYWDAFRKLHGDFLMEPPLSPAMKAFVGKRNECWKCGRKCKCQAEK